MDAGDRSARDQARYQWAMRSLIALTVLGAYDAFVPDGWWRAIPGGFDRAAHRTEALAPEPGASASPSLETSATRPPPRATPAPPRDLPQPYPTPRTAGGGRPYLAGPAWRSKDGALVDHNRQVVHVQRWPLGDLVALDPRTGDEVYLHAQGAAPLAVLGNRLLAQGAGSLWINDTHDGAAVVELPLPLLPPLEDRAFRASKVEALERAGDVVVVHVLRDELTQGGAESAHAVEDYVFGLDLVTGRVVACPPPEDREPITYDMRLAEMTFAPNGGALHARQHADPRNGRPRWQAWLRSLYNPPPRVAAPAPPLPQPWPTPRVAGPDRPFEPGPAYVPPSVGALADPLREVYHLMRADDLAAVDPRSGEVVYVHGAGEQPLAVLGNRLLARSDDTLWVLDTLDGAPVFSLTSPHLPPLLNTERRLTGVHVTWGEGSVLVLETFLSEATARPEDPEQTPWVTTRYAFGVDVATGHVVDAPARPTQAPGLEEGRTVGHFLLDFDGPVARGADLDRDWQQSLWRIPLRELRELPPPRVEAEDAR